MKLHQAGYSILVKTLIALVAVNLVVFFLVPVPAVYYTVLALTTILYFFVLNFFRSPNRTITVDDGSVFCPADGKIVVIEETYEPEYLKRACLQVSVFMNILNVHINWFPVNGTVTFYKHHNGKFMAAYLPKSSTENERSTIAIKTAQGDEIVMRQIAGAMAKRIVTYAGVGTAVRQDRHAGFIKFGSRVDLYLPLGTDIRVSLDQRVTGSQTLIGILPTAKS